MTLKNNGKSKKKKNYLKCDKCKERFEANEDDFTKIESVVFIECPYCGQQKLINKR